MATFKMEVDGKEVAFPSEEHAARFFLAMQRVSAGIEPARQKKGGKAPRKNADVALTMLFLDAILQGGEDGARSEDVMKVLGVTGARGIGSKLAAARKALKEVGIDHKTVFFKHRIAGRGRFWKQGKNFEAAYSAVKRKAGL